MSTKCGMQEPNSLLILALRAWYAKNMQAVDKKLTLEGLQRPHLVSGSLLVLGTTKCMQAKMRGHMR